MNFLYKGTEMETKDKLQINLITYNRKDKLKKTLDSLLDKNSPVKNSYITILDNASTDGSSELIDEYCSKYQNLKHIRHNKNIGGNANICRAFEIANKEYLWVLCDDDEFDFSNWQEIENAILSDKYDVIYTINHLCNTNTPQTIPALLFLAAFVPGCIYRSSYITSDLLINMYGCINTWYPHAIPSIDILVNNNGSYFIPKKNIVLRVTVDDLKGEVFHRGQNKKQIHPDLSRMFWHVGYMKILKFVQDEKVRKKLCESVTFNELFDKTGKQYIKFVLDHNAIYKDNNLDNYWDIFRSVSFCLKLYMIYYLLLGRYIRKVIQTIFSIKNEERHKVWRVFGIQIKFRRKK